MKAHTHDRLLTTDEITEVLKTTMHATTGIQGATLLWIPKLQVNTAFREWVITQITDPKAFWVEEFATYTPQFR